MPAHSASRALIVCLACAVLALRPVPVVEGVLDWALAPLRLVAEMAAPVGQFETRMRSASGRAVLRSWEEDLRRQRLLEEVVQASALPSSRLDSQRLRTVHGEVVGRERGARDRLRVRVEDASRLEPGQPVVHGDWYVGRVWTVPGASRSSELGPDEIVVELVTAATSRICARVRPEVPGGESSCRMVVGGLAPRQDEDWLAVHNPSERGVHGGTIEVHEPESLTDTTSQLANGFLLGELLLDSDGPRAATGRSGGRSMGIRPGLDYDSGLYQVLVLTPEDGGFVSRPRRGVGVLEDGAWRGGRLVLRGTPSPWREGYALALGRVAGVRSGSALAAGARLFGRVEHAGLFHSAVRSVGDPGFAVAGLALCGELPDEPAVGPGGARPVEAAAGVAPAADPSRLRPHVLGRLTSLGRDAEGRVLLQWPATVPLEGDVPVPALLYTGSGEPGIPRGLLIGSTTLPPGSGPHVLRVEQPEGTREPYHVSVRLPDRALLQGLEGGGS